MLSCLWATKKQGRKDSKVRKLVGRKCDGILRKLGIPEEYVISEEEKLWDGESDGVKWSIVERNGVKWNEMEQNGV